VLVLQQGGQLGQGRVTGGQGRVGHSHDGISFTSERARPVVWAVARPTASGRWA
jgi:hypothetical protein